MDEQTWVHGRGGGALLDAVAGCDDMHVLRMGVAVLIHKLDRRAVPDEAMAVVALYMRWMNGLR